jgi:hypothetical protein
MTLSKEQLWPSTLPGALKVLLLGQEGVVVVVGVLRHVLPAIQNENLKIKKEKYQVT